MIVDERKTVPSIAAEDETFSSVKRQLDGDVEDGDTPTPVVPFKKSCSPAPARDNAMTTD